MAFLSSRRAAFAFLLLIVGLCSVAKAQTPLQLYNEKTALELSPYFHVLRENDRRLSIQEILDQQNQFIPSEHKNPNFGYINRGFWLRAEIENVSNINSWMINVNFSQIDHVDFYLVIENRVIQQSLQGKKQGQQRYRLPTFDMDLPVGQPAQVYVRLQSESSPLIAPIFIQSADSQRLSHQIDGLAWGLFYGGLVILALYNLVLFFNVRQFSLIAYVFYIATVLAWQFIWGGHIQLAYPNGIPLWLSQHTEIIFTAIGVSSGLFTLFFLETRNRAKKLHYSVLAVIVLQIALSVLFLTLVFESKLKNHIVYGVGIFAIAIYISAGIEALINKFRPAIYFIAAWTFLAIGAAVGILGLTGIVPHSALTAYCFQVGVFLQAALFSVALMEKSRSQLQDEVTQASNDLRNNMELIEEQNVRLDLARKDAIKASNIKSQFLANMSHEIRTPLNAILGFSRELENTPLGIEQNEQVRIINSAADNLLTIVNDVLDFSKIEAGKLEIKDQPFSPLALFEDMVAIMAKSAHLKGLDFVFYSDHLPEKLIGDASRIKQVLTNLIGNALKFTSHGHVALMVRTQRKAHGIIDLIFEVSDSGIGISRADRKKLFSAFSQVDDALNRSYQGTGLGLVISQELVRLMNGSITLRSEKNLGSTFSVVVSTNQLSPRSHLVVANAWKGKTVFVFDPFPESRRALASTLKNCGAEVASFDSLQNLRKQKEADFLMVCLPFKSRFDESEIMLCATQLKAKNRVVWYCKDDPLSVSPALAQAFTRSIRLPATPNRLNNLLAHSNINLAKISPYPNKKMPPMKILAVDDMPMNLMLLQTWFNRSDATLTLAYSGQQAVDYCRNQEFDLILMDVQMPNMDGLKASKLIRQTDINIGTPIIAVTAHAFKEEQDRLLASGMDDYLPKPIAFEQLYDIILRWCDLDPIDDAENTSAVDIALAKKRANNDLQTSKLMLSEFLNLAPSIAQNIQALHAKADLENLTQEVHKLHGASCYTGAPEIQSIAEEIESALKRQEMLIVNKRIPDLLSAVRRFELQGAIVLKSL